MALLLAAGVVSVVAQSGKGGSKAKPYTTWTAYGGGPHSSQFTALDQINKANVSQLQVAWTYPVNGNITFNPLVVDNVMYVQGTGNAIVAIDAATGKEIWTHPNQGAIGARGMNYWESADRADRRLIYLNAGNITAIDARTGQSITSFGVNGKVDLRTALWRDVRNPLQTSNPGRIYKDTIIMSLPAQGAGYEANPADVQAYDVRTGKVKWVFHTIPLPGEFGYDTWPDGAFKTAGGVHNWSELTVDEENETVFIPTGTGRFDFYGGNRKGADLYANCLVALDATNGKVRWYRQLVHHDLWDFDLPQSPKLLTLRRNGRTIQAVAQATKMGFVFVFDRKTGDPVFPIEERPVPQSDVPGEASWPTQPFPTKPAPFERQGSSQDNLIDFTPELRQQALTIVKRYVTGPLFTPPSIRGTGPNDTRGTIQLPGSVGGADWQGAAFDPESGLLYVPSITTPFVADLLPGDPAKTNLAYTRGTREWIGGPQGLPLFKPPYGRITAIDLNRGEHRWMVANGDGPRNHPAIKHLNLPPLGNPGRAAPLATKTLLFIGEGSPAMAANGARLPAGMPQEISPGWGGSGFKALDKSTGATLWRTDLPAGTTGAPMTYLYQGKQYVVVAVGEQGHGAEWIALGLP